MATLVFIFGCLKWRKQGSQSALILPPEPCNPINYATLALSLTHEWPLAKQADLIRSGVVRRAFVPEAEEAGIEASAHGSAAKAKAVAQLGSFNDKRRTFPTPDEHSGTSKEDTICTGLH